MNVARLANVVKALSQAPKKLTFPVSQGFLAFKLPQQRGDHIVARAGRAGFSADLQETIGSGGPHPVPQ